MRRAVNVNPVFSTILRDRRMGAVISAAALLQLLLTLGGLPGWQCPVFHALGIPCPGCGMTRATLFLVHGQWKQALTVHAFAPILLIALAVITFCTIGPRERVERMAARTETLERHTGLTILLLGGLILYWLARLLFMQATFVQLIRG